MLSDIDLPPPGTPPFFPALLSSIRTIAAAINPTTPLPIDPVILRSILLCLIPAETKNLILRCPEEDISLVLKLTTLTLQEIFAYPTHRIRIRAPAPSPAAFDPTSSSRRSNSRFASESSIDLPTSANSFLRALFLPNGSASPPSKYARRPRPKLGLRTSSGYVRSLSVPADLAWLAHNPNPFEGGSPASSYPTASPDASSSVSYISPISATSRANASLASASTSTATNTMRHPYTDPTPLDPPSADRPLSTDEDTGPDSEGVGRTPELPRAIVIAGLEYSSNIAHRALIDVLREKRVILEGPDQAWDVDESASETSRGKSKSGSERTRSTGRNVRRSRFQGVDDQVNVLEDGVWNLPDGFIVVYVCPLDEYERPAIHKTLLDKFAMSATVFLQPRTRHAIQSVSFSLAHPHLGHQNTRPSPSPSLPLALPPITPPHRSAPLPKPYAPTSHHPNLHLHPPPATSAFPTPLPALLPALRALHARTTAVPTLNLYTADLFSAARHHPRLDGTLLGLLAMRDAADLIRAARVVGGDLTGAEIVRLGASAEDAWAGSLDVSEADVARIVPRVMSHRLRVKHRREEVLGSLLSGAVRVEEEEEGEDERETVKEILVEILAAV